MSLTPEDAELIATHIVKHNATAHHNTVERRQQAIEVSGKSKLTFELKDIIIIAGVVAIAAITWADTQNRLSIVSAKLSSIEKDTGVERERTSKSLEEMKRNLADIEQLLLRMKPK